MIMIIKDKEKIYSPDRHYSHFSDEETEAQRREMAPAGLHSVSVAVSEPHSGFLRLQALCPLHWLCFSNCLAGRMEPGPHKGPSTRCSGHVLAVHGLPPIACQRGTLHRTSVGPCLNHWPMSLLGHSGAQFSYPLTLQVNLNLTWANPLFDRWEN